MTQAQDTGFSGLGLSFAQINLSFYLLPAQRLLLCLHVCMCPLMPLQGHMSLFSDLFRCQSVLSFNKYQYVHV